MKRLFFSLLLFSSIALQAEDYIDLETLAHKDELALTEILIKQALKFTQPPPDMTPPVKAEQEVTVDMRNPKYKNGILYTEEGGVIQNKDLRIQARSIQYIKRKEDGKSVQRIEAEGNILLQFKGRAYVGEELEFDFVNKTGTIYDGRTFAAPFYVGGDRILIKESGNYSVDNAFITTCENYDSTWDLNAGKVKLLKDDMLEAKKVRFRFFKFPIWLPSFKLSLKKFAQPIIRYKLTWDKGAGPRAYVRYQVFSWKEFALFLRGEYRLKRGFGGALETEYIPSHGRTVFLTKNYLATDVIPTNPVNKRRYRIQGEFHSKSPNGKTTADMTWDKYSDVLMPGDFKDEDFELNTAKRTMAYVRHHESDLIASLYVRARANSFETVKQELPTAFGAMRPLRLSSTGIIAENWAKASYLDLDYSDDLAVKLRDFNAGRLETHHELYRPIHLGPVLINPNIGVVGIYYSNNPFDQSIGFGLLKYGILGKCDFSRVYTHHKHVIEPYALFDGYSRPTTNVDDHFIFSIQDGYNRQNLFRVGVRNLVFSKRSGKVNPTFAADLYADAFFADKTMSKLFPWMFLNFQWNLPSLAFYSNNAWTFLYNTVQFANLRGEWTLNENFALSLEVRYRSKYDWRKADHENFFLDLTRSQEDLLASPLSDRRITLLTHFYVRLTPFWSAHFQSHHGFYRLDQKPYNEFKVDLFTWISSSWKLRISYLHADRDDRVSAGLELIKK